MFWKTSDDRRLVNYVVSTYIERDYAIDWDDVARQLKGSGKTGEQCYRRWKCSLDPTKNRSRWTEKDDISLLKFQSILGNKWNKIGKLLNNRTEVDVKNRFNGLKKKEEQSQRHLKSLIVSDHFGDPYLPSSNINQKDENMVQNFPSECKHNFLNSYTNSQFANIASPSMPHIYHDDILNHEQENTVQLINNSSHRLNC